MKVFILVMLGLSLFGSLSDLRNELIQKSGTGIAASLFVIALRIIAFLGFCEIIGLI